MNKRKFYYISPFVVIIFTFFSCNKQQEKAEIIFEQAESLVEKYPDSALFLLNSIRQPIKLPKEQYAQYILLTLEAKNKTGKDSSLFLSNKYFSSSVIEEKNGNYNDALKYYKLYTNILIKILENDENKSILEIQEKYNHELLKNKNDRLKIERLWIYLAILLFISSGCCCYFRKKTQYKNKVLEGKAIMQEAKQQISSLKSITESHNEKKYILQTEVLQYIEILKKIALLNEQKLIKNDQSDASVTLQKINKIIYGNKKGFDWEILFRAICALHNEIFDYLSREYPQLDDIDLKICYLDYTGFFNAEISTFLKLATNTIIHKKSIIRKKIGVTDYGNIAEFIDKNLEKNHSDLRKPS